MTNGNITFISGGDIIKNISFAGRRTIYELLTRTDSGSHGRNLNSHLNFACGGKKTCGKCRVRIISGLEFVSKPSETEKKYISEKDGLNNIRYACMCEVYGNIAVELNPGEDNSNNKSMQIQTDGIKSVNIIPDRYKKLARENKKETDIYGAAVDIGTTTAAVYLYSMTDGKLIGVAAKENPQRLFGADVITRINYTIENPEGLDNLKNLILSLVFELIYNLCGENNINTKNIYYIVLAGNTVMQHIAMGLSPETIAFAPFTPVSLFGFETDFDSLGVKNIDMNQSAKIYFPPAFASYVGGDISSGIIASGIDLSEKLVLFLDIGTNGEIGLGNKNSLAFCATAAGPAFEGAHIKFGMAGVPGAINKIELDESNNIIYETINKTEPKGICGSGIIDAVSVMLELEVLDETGRIIGGEKTDGENIFYITPDIYITQKDIREIQLAKASVCAGIITLLHHTGKTISDIDELVLAGGFGAHINKKSACRIGLIPKELEDKIITAGNAAGTGASALLLDLSSVERIEKTAEISKYIELSGDGFFMDEYIEQMTF
ncbi:MAG: ASKHA domain-containing protein [Oscillospiraceae bacterium]|nr:ASKHA domain-containing protein [Oscillospiraceae bacterium]